LLTIQTEARLQIHSASGRLERHLRTLARGIAEEQNADDVSCEHVSIALQALESNITELMQLLLDPQGASHVERRAG